MKEPEKVRKVEAADPPLAELFQSSHVVLELKAKDRSVSYDRVLLWVTKSDNLPIKAHYFTLSGKLLKVLRFTAIKDFSGHKRPTTLIMQNRINKQSRSELTVLELEAGKTLGVAMFQRSSLTR